MRRGLMCLAPCLLMSCLVVDPVEVPEEVNLPPSIMSTSEAAMAGTSLDRIVVVDVGDGSQDLQLPVLVRDPNREQDLEWQLWLDFTGTNLDALVASGTIEQTGQMDRPMTFTVPFDRLLPAERCRRVEVLVTSRFDGGTNFRGPVEPLDIAQAVWWVRVIDSEAGLTNVSLESCP